MLSIAGFAIISAASGNKSWEAAAADLGLRLSTGFTTRMEGSVDGFPVDVRKHKDTIEIELFGQGAIPPNFRLNAEGMLRNVLSGRDIEIGCPVFDSKTHVSNPAANYEAEACALLDYRTRNTVFHVVVKKGAKVESGKITVNKRLRVDEVPAMVRAFVDLARALRMTRDEIPARLAATALEDPVSSVRLRSLTLLQRRFTRSVAAVEASRASLRSEHDSIRLAAAIFLGSEGHEVIHRMALSDHVSTDLRVKALDHVTFGSDHEGAIKLGTKLLVDLNVLVRRAAIRSVGRFRHAASIDTLISLLDPSEAATSVEIIQALRNIGDPSVEPTLVRLLQRSTSNRITTAVIVALGDLGSIKAVEPLHRLSKRGRFKRQARIAIDSIQSRLGDAESGRLSLAPTVDPRGALSLAGDPEKAGGLSLDDE